MSGEPSAGHVIAATIRNHVMDSPVAHRETFARHLSDDIIIGLYNAGFRVIREQQ